MFEFDFIVGSNDVDCFYDLKVSSIYQLFQEAAMKDVERFGSGSNVLKEKNLDWIITNMTVEIYRLPVLLEKIKVITYPGDDMGFLYPRYFVIRDEKGNDIVKSISIWGLLDITTRHLSFGRNAVAKLTPEHLKDELSRAQNPVEQDVELYDKRKIYYSEIDLNSHLNNCSYIKLLVDLKDKKFYEKYKISRINVSYKKELNEGDKVDIYCSNLNPNYIEIKKGDESCFTAEVTYICK